MAQLSKSTTHTRTFFMTLAADHITGATGKTVSVSISKAGAAFSAAAGSVSEIANGFYKIALTTADTNTDGDLAFHATATDCDATDFIDQVIDPDYLLKRDMSAVGSPASRSMLNALRLLRNKYSFSGNTLTVCAEDDLTAAWTATVTVDSGASPITGMDPA